MQGDFRESLRWFYNFELLVKAFTAGVKLKSDFPATLERKLVFAFENFCYCSKSTKDGEADSFRVVVVVVSSLDCFAFVCFVITICLFHFR